MGGRRRSRRGRRRQRRRRTVTTTATRTTTTTATATVTTTKMKRTTATCNGNDTPWVSRRQRLAIQMYHQIRVKPLNTRPAYYNRVYETRESDNIVLVCWKSWYLLWAWMPRQLDVSRFVLTVDNTWPYCALCHVGDSVVYFRCNAIEYATIWSVIDEFLVVLKTRTNFDFVLFYL